MVRTQSEAFASGTKSNMKSHINSYLSFCIYFALTALPLDCTNLLPFLQLFSQSVRSFHYVNNVLSSIRTISRLLGYTIDHITTVQLSLFMSGLKRNMGIMVSQSLPITPHMLLHMSEYVQFSDSFELCVWSAIVFMFFSFFRKSNVMPDSISSFDNTKQLSRNSILVDPSDMFMIVRVTWSKTIQFAHKVLYVPISSVPGSKLCPVSNYVKLCHLVPSPLTSPAFVYYCNNRVVPLVYNVFVKQLRYWLICVNVQSPYLYSSHSLRRGGATWAFQCGVSPELIKLQGDWQSDCYLRYINVSLTRKFTTSSQMARAVLRL